MTKSFTFLIAFGLGALWLSQPASAESLSSSLPAGHGITTSYAAQNPGNTTDGTAPRTFSAERKGVADDSVRTTGPGKSGVPDDSVNKDPSVVNSNTGPRNGPPPNGNPIRDPGDRPY